MENHSYNKISGRKTLILVITLIVIIIALSIYSVILMIKKSSVLTNSASFEPPLEEQIKHIPTATPIVLPQKQNIPIRENGMPTRHGD